MAQVEDEFFEALTIESGKYGRVVTNVSDAIEASITINVDKGHGSGFFISDSLVLTNYHVIEDQKSITTTSNSRIFTFEVIAQDSLWDLAILKSDLISDVYFSMEQDSLVCINVGEDILIVGSPTSELLSNSLSSGIISGIREFDKLEILQTDAKINPGNSGGALFNSEGNLLGVVTAKVFGFGVEGIGFAIPKKYIIKLLKQNAIIIQEHE